MINLTQTQKDKVTEATLIAHGYWSIPSQNGCYRNTTITANIMYALKKNKGYIESYYTANGATRLVGMSPMSALTVNTYRMTVHGKEKVIEVVYNNKVAMTASENGRIDWSDALECINISDSMTDSVEVEVVAESAEVHSVLLAG